MAHSAKLKRLLSRSYLHLTTALILLATSALYLWLATKVRVPLLGDPVGPRLFPIGLGSMLLLCSALMLAGIFWRAPEKSDAEDIPGQLKAWAVFALLGAYAFVLPWVGLLLATTVFATLVLSLIRFRSLPVNILTAALIAGGFHIVFRVWLGVPLPALSLG